MDKTNKVAVLNTKDYFNEMETCIDDMDCIELKNGSNGNISRKVKSVTNNDGLVK